MMPTSVSKPAPPRRRLRRWAGGVFFLLTLLLLSGFENMMNPTSWKVGALSSCAELDPKLAALKEPAANNDDGLEEPCQIRNLTMIYPAQESSNNVTEHSAFSIDAIQCVVKDKKTNIPMIRFNVLECPPAYHQSTFTLESRDESSSARIMGRVGPRNKIRKGCGIYEAQVGALAQVKLYWTSNHKWYSNRILDIDFAHGFKTKSVSDRNNMSDTEIDLILGHERNKYQKKHYDFVVGFSFEAMVDRTRIQGVGLKDCSDLPVADWGPLGVFYRKNAHTNSSMPRPYLGSTQCNFPNYTAERLNEDFRGMRVRLLLDSHGGAMRTFWIRLLCPKIAGDDLFGKYNDDCPDPKYDWLINYRFFRAIFENTEFNSDMDGISSSARKGDKDACVKFLGLGHYNVTIIGLPTWLMVYETNEGLDNFLTSIESLLSECKELHPALVENHIFLLQTAVATDSATNPTPSGASSWRGIQNYRLQGFSDEAARRLGPHVDGVIPVFDLTFAWLDDVKKQLTRDGVHLQSPGYDELFNAMMAGVSSAMKSRGLTYFSTISDNRTDPRWWTTLPKGD